jgi:signal transduction histidine kinase/CheY-like chemotaxis protein
MSNRLTVLIVEDSEDDAILIIRLLRKAGHDIQYRRIENEDQMKGALQAQNWDIVIADYNLPQFNGFEALRVLQETGIDIPFILVSGTIGEETAAAMMKAGAHDYLRKGNMTRLVPAVMRELAQAEVRREHAWGLERLRESEIFVKDILNSLPFQVAVLDREGLIITVNEAWNSFARANGVPEDSGYYIGSNYLAVAKEAALKGDDETAGLAARGIEAVMKGTEEFFSLEYPCHSMEKKRWFVMRVSPLSGEKHGVVVAHVNITETKLAKEEQTKLEIQLLQAQKMEALGKLASGVAHDFNNMLSVIKGYTELALQKSKVSDPIRRYLEQIDEASKRSEDLVRQLLAFARKQTIKPKIIHINDVIQPLLSMLRTLTGERIKIGWSPGYISWQIRMDATQISQIMTNLAANARDAISGTGNVTIETLSASINKQDETAYRGLLPGEYVVVKFSDDGCGMDKETLVRIFEPFFTTKPEGKGTGLGLATVYGIIKQNKGFIYANSEPGKGTAIEIYLPRYRSDQEVTEQT